MLAKFLKRIYIAYLRKKKKLDKLSIDRPTYIHCTATFHFHAGIKIGRYCRIGHLCHIDGEGGVEIGDGTIFAPKVVILSSSQVYQGNSLLPYTENDKKLPVKIGRGCWLGWGAIVCPGVTIGDGAIVGVGSVVTKDVLRGHIVGGNPARTLKVRDENIDIAKLVSEEKYYLKAVLNENLKRAGRRSDSAENLVS